MIRAEKQATGDRRRATGQRHRPWLVAIVLVLGLAGAGGGVARAQSNPQLEQAKKEYDLGQTAYNLAKYDEALAHYEKAYELSKLPGLLFNLAQAHRRLYETGGQLENLRRARELYKSYLRLVPLSSERPLAEQLSKEVEAEYGKQLHARRDKLLIEAKGQGALNLAEDFLGQGDTEAAAAALERFVKSPGIGRPDVARGLRVRARLHAAAGKPAEAAEAFARALALDPSVAPPPDSEPAALAAFGKAQARMKDVKPLALTHVPPTRVKIGQAPKLRIDVSNDPLSMVKGLELHYRAGQSAWAKAPVKPGDLTFPGAFNAGLAPGTRIEYWVSAVGEDDAVLDTLGSAGLPFVLHVDQKPEKPVYKRWQFWVGLGAGAVVVAGAAAAVGVTQAPPDRVGVPVFSGLVVH